MINWNKDKKKQINLKLELKHINFYFLMLFYNNNFFNWKSSICYSSNFNKKDLCMAENYKNGNSKNYENILKEIYLNI